jgi:hypothetical protein
MSTAAAEVRAHQPLEQHKPVEVVVGEKQPLVPHTPTPEGVDENYQPLEPQSPTLEVVDEHFQPLEPQSPTVVDESPTDGDETSDSVQVCSCPPFLFM